MAAKKKQAAPPTGASPAPAPQVVNAAPGYAAPPPQPAPPAFAGGGYGNPYGQPAPGGPVPGFTAGPNGAQAAFTAPPPQAPRNPFVNAQFLYQFGKPVRATINGIRVAQGGNNKFGDRQGWFLDMTLENGQAVCGRVNVGDQRHQRLYAAFGDKIIGRSVVLRLPNPGDNTKAAWTLDAA